jgi:putative ABC transport system permease protein
VDAERGAGRATPVSAAGRRGWLRMSALFLLRSLRLRAATHLFALTAIATGAGVAATMLTLRADLGAKMSRELRRYGPNLLLAPAADRVPSLLDEAAVRSAGVPGIVPMLIATGSVSGRDRARQETAGVVGANLEALAALNPWWRVEGAWPRPDAPAPGALVGKSIAGRLGIAPGDTLTLAIPPAALEVTVTGLVESGEAEEEQVILPLADLQRATGLPGRVTIAAMAVDGGVAAVERAAARLERAVPGAVARPLRPIAMAQGAVLARLERMMLIMTLVVLVLSGLCLATTLMAMVVERESEIGLLRAMGGGDRDVLRMIAGEVTVLGVAGGLIGLGLGAAAARLIGRGLFGAAIQPRAEVVPWVLLIAVAVCWVAVVVPLRRALAIRPALALRAE